MGIMITKMLEMDKEKMNEPCYCRQKWAKNAQSWPQDFLALTLI
jgi:hypothetical protein